MKSEHRIGTVHRVTLSVQQLHCTYNQNVESDRISTVAHRPPFTNRPRSARNVRRGGSYGRSDQNVRGSVVGKPWYLQGIVNQNVSLSFTAVRWIGSDQFVIPVVRSLARTTL